MAYEDGTIVEVKIGYVVNTQQCYNVVHYIPESNGPGFSPFELCGQLTAHIFGNAATNGTLLKEMLDFMSEDATVNEITAQAVFPTRYRMALADASLPGLVASACNVQNSAGVIQKLADGGSRHDIGSFHLGAVPVNAQEEGFLTVAARNQLANVATALKATLVDVGAGNIDYTPVILNKTKVIVDGKPKFVISGSKDLKDTVAKDSLRTMRRRTVRYGI